MLIPPTKGSVPPWICSWMRREYLHPVPGSGIYEHWNEPYIHEVGRTDDILQMEQCLNKLANRYTDDDIFTLPLSLDAYTESMDPTNLGNDFVMDDRTQLTKQEIKNFYSGKKAMKKLEQYI